MTMITSLENAGRLVPAAVISLLVMFAPIGGAAAPLVVGVKEAPPFVIKRADGTFSGLSIDLWRAMAHRLDLEYQFEETDLGGLLGGVTDGRFDAAVGALTVTEAREHEMDFTHPFYTAGLAIAVPASSGSPWRSIAQNLLSTQFLGAVAGLFALLTLVGVLAWLAERRGNPEEFGGSPPQGIGAGFWWAAVTMTTVGYGDKTPRTIPGRLLGLLWMFAGIILISSFTAAMATAFTVGSLSGTVSGPADLKTVRVATVAASSSAQYLTNRGINVRRFANLDDALQHVAADEADAVVYDSPLLRYRTRKRFAGIVKVLPVEFAFQHYAVALHEGSPLREDLNRALLAHTRSSQWQQTIDAVLGKDRTP